jgi:hypothetical protein
MIRALRLTLPLIVALPAPAAGQAATADLRELRAGVVASVARRGATFAGADGRGSGTLLGGEVRARFGLLAGVLRVSGGGVSPDSGTAAGGDIHRGDVDFMVGPPVIHGRIGYGRRVFTGAVGSRPWSSLRLGVASEVGLGSSGLQAGATAGLNLGLGDGNGGGREIETRLTWAPTHLPLWFAIGYGVERFTADERPETVAAVVLASGVRW